MTAPPRGEHRLVVRSIHRAPLSIHRPLLPLTGLSPAELVGRLYRAPAILLDGVREDVAVQLDAILRDGGLDTAVEPQGAPFTPGEGDRDVAIHLGDPGQLRAVASVVAEFLGADLSEAARVCQASPAILVGQVSEATVEALRVRLTPLGVELDVSTPETASYDLFLADDDAGARALVSQLVRNHGLRPLPSGPLVASDLPRRIADALWRDLQGRAGVRMVDRNFERFDVRLDAAPATPEVRDVLMRQTGMPARVAERVARHLPLVLHTAVRGAEAERALIELASVGATGVAVLQTFQSFDLVIERAEDPAAGATLLELLTDQPAAGWLSGIRRPPLKIPGPFTGTQARWMRAELAGVGVSARLEAR